EVLAATLTGTRPSVRVSDSIEAGLDGAEAEVAIVATVHSALGPSTLAALGAGCHVLVEKPGAHRLEDLVAVRDAARAAGKVVKVGFNHRFHPALLEAREIAAEKPYGELMHIRGRYGHGGRPGYEKEWRGRRGASGGGELVDRGSRLVARARPRAAGGELALAAR